jgi:dihydropteroate synthase
MSRWRLAGGRELEFPPPLAAGVVNVTDDSFFSGARSGTPERAVEDGLELVRFGFDLLDVGAVAARSGDPVAPGDESARLLPALERLVAESGVPVAADTFSPVVAGAAVAAGAAAINDISGAADPGMLDLVAESGCGYVLMHIEGPPRVDRPAPRYGDPVDQIRAWFSDRIEAALARGVDAEQIALDPGLDFDLTVDDDLVVLRRLGELRDLGRPLFVALSRKDFLGAVLAGSWEGRRAVEDREWATAAAAALAAAAGADVLRLHDRSALDAMRTAAAISARAAIGEEAAVDG